MADELIPDAPGEDEPSTSTRNDSARIRGCERLLRSALEQVGVAAERTYWDSVYLRIVPPTPSGQVGTIGFHRDTWASNVLQQTNWWLPLRPLTEERTIAFYPGYWSKPIANTSADWDLAEIRRAPPGG